MTQQNIRQHRFDHALCIALFAIASLQTAHTAELSADKTEYDAGALRLEHIRADINIRVKPQDGITVSYSGSHDSASTLDTSVEYDTLTIRQRKSTSTRVGNVSVITTGAGTSKSTVTIDGETVVANGDGVVVIHGQTATGKPRLNITVSPGTPLILIDFRGNADIGDVRGPLTLDTTGNVRIGQVTRASLHVRRSGDVVMDSVTDTLDLEVTGNGDVRIDDGDISAIKARVSKNGKIHFDGHATEADLFATGNGNLSVTHVEHQPRVRVSRNGDVSIGNWRATHDIARTSE